MSSLLDQHQILQNVHDEATEALQVSIVAGGTTITIESEKVDGTAFNPDSDTVITIGAVADNVAPDSVDEGDVGAVRMSNNRNLFTSLRDAAGNERGVNVTAGNALTVDGSASTQPISAASLPLPTGASTEATLSTLNGKVTAVDTGAVVVSSSALPSGASTAARQDTGNTALAAIQVAVEALDNAVAGSELQVDVITMPTVAVTGTFWQATQPVSAASLPLPSGAATEAKQDTEITNLAAIKTAVETIDNAIAGSEMQVDVLTMPVVAVTQSGTWTVNALDVVDFFDTPVLITSSVNIPASGSNPVAVVASLAANVKKLKINWASGEFVGVYTGVALSEVLQCIVGPGEDGTIEVAMSSGERVSLRNMANVAISAGDLCIQFLG